MLALIAVPVMLLGAASPYALRLAVPDVEHAGRIAGRLYAISTAGSLVGTMISALLLIPLLGTQRTFLVFALAIARRPPRSGSACASCPVPVLLARGAGDPGRDGQGHRRRAR